MNTSINNNKNDNIINYNINYNNNNDNNNEDQLTLLAIEVICNFNIFDIEHLNRWINFIVIENKIPIYNSTYFSNKIIELSIKFFGIQISKKLLNKSIKVKELYYKMYEVLYYENYQSYFEDNFNIQPINYFDDFDSYNEEIKNFKLEL